MNRSDGFLSRFCCLPSFKCCLLATVAPAFADEAENYYVANVEALVQGKCIACHRTGGQAASSGVDLLFTSSAVRQSQGV